MSALAKRYAKDVLAHNRTLSSCPARYKEDIIAYLKEQLDAGVITQEEYDELINS